jgi:glycosyltransferase involved in cell wall biosynthesis
VVVSDLEAMASAVQGLLADESLWAREGARAAEYVRRHHGVGAVVDAYEAVFQRVMARGGAPVLV